MYDPSERAVELDHSMYAALMEALEPSERVMKIPGGRYTVGQIIDPIGLIMYVRDPSDGDFRTLVFVPRKAS